MQFIQQNPIFHWDVSLLSFKDTYILIQRTPKSKNLSFVNPSTEIIHIMLAIFLKEQQSFFDCLVNRVSTSI